MKTDIIDFLKSFSWVPIVMGLLLFACKKQDSVFEEELVKYGLVNDLQFFAKTTLSSRDSLHEVVYIDKDNFKRIFLIKGSWSIQEIREIK